MSKKKQQPNQRIPQSGKQQHKPPTDYRKKQQEGLEKSTAGLSAHPFGSLEDWRIYVIIGVSVSAIAVLVILNIVDSIRNADTVKCVQTMAVVSEAAREMDQDIGFDVDISNNKSAPLLVIYNYYKYGKDALAKDADGKILHPLTLIDRSKLSSLTPVKSDKYILDGIMPCPRKGEYIYVSTPRGLAIECSYHGLFEPMDSKGHYVFHGSFDNLGPVDTGTAEVATVYLPYEYKTTRDEVSVVAPEDASLESEDTTPEMTSEGDATAP